MYDIFFIDLENNFKYFEKLKTKYPLIKKVRSFNEAQRRCLTSMFWVIWPNLDILDTFGFDIEIEIWDKEYIHVFKNGRYYDGVCLFPKNKKITAREIEYRFFTEKKEIDIVASEPKLKLYDIVFISYFEQFSDSHYEKIKSRFLNHNIHHVKNIKGIHNAHIEAAKLSNTEMFWVVDADAIIVDSFNFIFQIPYYEKDTVYVWQSQNPINDLVYGYGGIKLLPKDLTMCMNLNTIDMTTSISSRFKPINEVSNITKFNTDPFNTWRSAFRECVKLSSKLISRQVDDETENRLNMWCTVGADKEFGKYCIAGARAGREFGIKNKNNEELLSKINDWTWLENEFQKYSLE